MLFFLTYYYQPDAMRILFLALCCGVVVHAQCQEVDTDWRPLKIKDGMEFYTRDAPFSKLKEVIPIKIETKRVKLTIPARFTGQIYSTVSDFKESETWLDNGDLEIIVNIPSGMQIDFYEKLNSVTHGAVQSEEMSQKAEE